ncbi:hypothetical protein ACFQXB_09830, partial [Plastorhodobacter daqingensis]
NIRSPYIAFRPVPELPRSIELVVAWPAGETSALVLDFIETTRRVAPGLARELGLEPAQGPRPSLP